MKTSTMTNSKLWSHFLLLLVFAAIIAACGGDRATSTPTAVPTATTAPTKPAESTPTQVPTTVPTAAAAPESPLAQPNSPLAQPESPLTTSASKPQSEEEAIALAAQTKASEPTAGMGSIAGVLFSYGLVPGGIPETVVFLEPADEIDGKFYPASVSTGPRADRNDVAVQTNAFGQFYMETAPGYYYLSVWTVYNWLLAGSEVGEDVPRLITIEEGDQLDLGVLYVNWP